MKCPSCGTAGPRGRLVCSVCRGLLHREELEALVGEASVARVAGEVRTESEILRRALALLPPESRQHDTISRRVASLSAELDGLAPSVAKGDPEEAKKRWGGAGAIGSVALLAWKGKAILVFLLSKGKLLLAGLTKSGTLFSMVLAFGVYWTIFGWPFALGLVVSIYVHEMGHVAALRHYGIAASAPMFIPGLGAFVRLKQYPANPREDARVGLAGPIWGLGAALAAYAIFRWTAEPIWAAIARFGAWINLFNLLPVWQLDGGRGFKALTQWMRIGVAAAMGVMLYLTGEGLLWLLLIAGAFGAFSKKAPDEGDIVAFGQFLFLVVALALLSVLPIPVEAFQAE